MFNLRVQIDIWLRKYIILYKYYSIIQLDEHSTLFIYTHILYIYRISRLMYHQRDISSL